MIAEGFREIGVLIFVFAILDKMIQGKITFWWTTIAVTVSAACFTAGCYLERRRSNA